jgi:hypothetical protein
VRLVDDDDTEVVQDVSPRSWCGRTPTWSMSGFVRIAFAVRRTCARCSIGVSPS